MGRKSIDILGQKYGRLTVMREVEKMNGVRRFECVCDCGNKKIVDMPSLRKGSTKSCGCLKKEKLSQRAILNIKNIHSDKSREKQRQTQIIDRTEKKYGHLTVLRQSENNKPGITKWVCKCDCGNIVEVKSSKLKDKNIYCSSSCDLLNCKKEDLSGKRFGMLSVIYEADKKGRPCWYCLCDCGNVCIRTSSSLKSGRTVSCGCDKIKRRAETRHIKYLKHDKAIMGTEQYFKICEVCGGMFYSNCITSTCCSKKCYTIKYSKQKSETIRICKQCGKEFIGEYKGEQFFCCNECRIEYTKNTKRLNRRKSKNKRRSILHSVPQDNYTYDDVFNKSNGICQLCGKPVTAHKSDVLWGGSIDHIIPLSKGGSDTLENVQLAHRLCNSIKCNDETVNMIDYDELSINDERYIQYTSMLQ